MNAGLFKGLSKLWEVNLRDNQLNRLEPGVFEGLSNVSTVLIDLNHNQLNHLETGVFKDLSNAVICLENNQLEVLEAGSFKGILHNVTFKLANNKLKTHLGALAHTIKKRLKVTIDFIS